MALTHRITTTARVQDHPNASAPRTGGSITDSNTQRVMPNGTGAGQADLLYDENHTIAAGGTLTLDFATGGGLEQGDGSAIAMVKMKGVKVVKTSGDGTFSMEIPANGVLYMATTGNKSCTFSDVGDFFFFQNRLGVTVTAATADELLVNEEGGADTVTLQVTAWGDSA